MKMLSRGRGKSSSPETKMASKRVSPPPPPSPSNPNSTTPTTNQQSSPAFNPSDAKKLAKILQESSISPRRVLDLDAVIEEETKKNSERRNNHRKNSERTATPLATTDEDDENDDTFGSERVLFPEADGEPSANLSQIHATFDIYGAMTKKRGNKKSISPLPTLSEASLEEGSEADPDQLLNRSSDSWDEGDAFPPESSSLMYSPAKPTPEPRKARKPAGATKRTAAEKVQQLSDDAADRAARGLEEAAVQLYRKALAAGRKDVTRIKGQLKEVSTKHHAVAAKSIASRLHEDWMEIGVLIANVRNAQATIYERLGSYDKAMTCCGEALAVYKRQAKFLKKQSPGSEVSVLAQIKTMIEATSRIDKARESYERRKKSHEEIIAMRMEMHTKKTAKERRNLYAALTEKVKRVRASESDILGSQHPQLGDTASLLGSLALEQGEKEKAIPYMMEAYAIMKQSLGMKHPRTGMKLLHIASVYNNPSFRKTRMEENLAMDFYKEAIEVFRASDNCPYLLGSTLNDLSVVYIARKDYQKAVEKLNEALAAYKQGQESDPSVSSWDTAQILLNLGECYTQQRDFEQASSAFLSALNVQRDGRKMYENAMKHDGNASGEHVPPAHLVDDRRIADTLRRLGRAYVGAAAYEKAMVFFKEACLIHKNEVKKAVQTHKGRDTNLLPAMQDELAQTIFCMAELNDIMGKTDTAARLYGESLQLRLFSDAHKPTRTNMVHCAMCLNGLGSIHMKRSEFVEAQGVFKEALGYCSAHGVPAEHPIVQMIEQRLHHAVESAREPGKDEQDDEAAKLELRAIQLFQQNKLDAAILTLTSVMQLRKEKLKKLRDDGGDSISAKYTTACTLKTFGEVLARKGDTASAERAFKDSLKLFKKAGTKPNELIVSQVCEELGKLQTSG